MKRNNLFIFIYIFIMLFFTSYNNPVVAEHHCDCCTCHEGTTLPKEIKNGTQLTIQDCISIGLKNSPVIKKHKYALDIAKSNVGIAKSVYFPTIGAGVGYGQINNSNNKYLPSVYRELPNVGVTLNKMIWDFGRTSARIKMEKFFQIGAEYEFMDSVCTTVFDIKTKYYNVLRAQSIHEAKKIDYDINEKLIADIKTMISQGKANQVDLINAQTQKFKIQNELLETSDALANAKEDLNNSMYFLNAPKYSITKTNSFDDTYKEKSSPFKLVSNKKLKLKTTKSETICPNFTYEQAVDIAYKNSPDIKVLEATKNAMEQSLLAIKRTYYPELNANVGYNFVRTNEYGNNDLTLGVNISSSLNAMEFKHSMKGGYAQVNLAQTEIEKYKEDLYFTVRKALNVVNKSKAQIPIAKEQLNSAGKNLNLTIIRYKQKEMDQLELLSARSSYNEAMESYVNAIYNYNIALINLEIAMHYHLIDLHDRTEHAMKYHEEDIIDRFNNIMHCDKHDKE